MTWYGLVLFSALVATVACRDGGKTMATVSPADSADQVLIGMSHYVTANGVQRAQVKADTAYFYSATQSALLRNVHITFYSLTGTETSTLTSREGTYDWRTSDMEARGNVVVVTKDGRNLRTAQMRFNEGKNEVTSDGAFVFDSPDRHIEGEGFTSDPEFKNVVATHPKGTGGGFTLPDQ